MRADESILAEVNKGPPRMRIATREELKMEINKLKNDVLGCHAELKKHGIRITKKLSGENEAAKGGQTEFAETGFVIEEAREKER